MRLGPTMGRLTSDLAGGANPAIDRTDVRHVCPECGGQLTSQAGALILVEVCWACHGAGTFDDHGLSVYLRQLDHRALQQQSA